MSPPSHPTLTLNQTHPKPTIFCTESSSKLSRRKAHYERSSPDLVAFGLPCRPVLHAGCFPTFLPARAPFAPQPSSATARAGPARNGLHFRRRSEPKGAAGSNVAPHTIQVWHTRHDTTRTAVPTAGTDGIAIPGHLLGPVSHLTRTCTAPIESLRPVCLRFSPND